MNFPTGLEDIDMKILYDLEDLNKVVSLYNDSRIIRLMLDKRRNFLQLKQGYDIHTNYINSMKELAILQDELGKAEGRVLPRVSKWDSLVHNFRAGDRIIVGDKNYVINTATDYKISYYEVNLLGNIIDNTKLHYGTLRGFAPGEGTT